MLPVTSFVTPLSRVAGAAAGAVALKRKSPKGLKDLRSAQASEALSKYECVCEQHDRE